MTNLNLIISQNKALPSYVKKETGNTVYVFDVTGDDASLKFYKKIKGKNLVLDKETGSPLFFSTRACLTPTAPLYYKAKDESFGIDTSAAKRIASLCEQYEGTLGSAIANRFLDQIMGAAPNQASKAEPEAQDSPAEAEEL